MVSSKKRKSALVSRVRAGPSSDDAHEIVYFKRLVEDDPSQAEPGRDALLSWPNSVRAKAVAVLIAVAMAPPKRFSGKEYLARNPRSVS